MIIYKATNKMNGKSYVGLTIRTLEVRKAAHLDSVRKGEGYYFHNAIRKYSKGNFEWAVIDRAENIDELKEKEVFWINFYNTYENGYNLTFGGEGSLGYKHTEEGLKKMSDAQKGKIISEEHKKKLSDAQKGEKHHMYGKHCPEERKKRISNAMEGEKNPRYGKYHTEETKKKQSDAHTGKIFSLEHRKNLSNAKKGKNVGEKSAWYGKHHSVESNKKNSDACKKAWVLRKAKKVKQVASV